jgi:hypothetical protein
MTVRCVSRLISNQQCGGNRPSVATLSLHDVLKSPLGKQTIGISKVDLSSLDLAGGFDSLCRGLHTRTDRYRDQGQDSPSRSSSIAVQRDDMSENPNRGDCKEQSAWDIQPDVA